MSDDGIRAVLLVEGIDQKCLVLFAVLNSRGDLFENLYGGVHENLVQVFLLANLVQKGVEGLDPNQLLLHAQSVTKGKKSFEIAKCHRYTRSDVLSLLGDGAPTSPAAVPITLHDTGHGVGERESLKVSASIRQTSVIVVHLSLLQEWDLHSRIPSQCYDWTAWERQEAPRRCQRVEPLTPNPRFIPGLLAQTRWTASGTAPSRPERGHSCWQSYSCLVQEQKQLILKSTAEVEEQRGKERPRRSC